MEAIEVELRRTVRRALEMIGDSVGPPPPFDDVASSAALDGGPPSGDSRRIFAVAGAAVVVVALFAGLALLDGDQRPSPISGADTTEQIVSTLAEVVPAPSTDPSSTVPVVAQLTIDEVRVGQAEALRRLGGFTATAEVTQLFGSGDDQRAETRTSDVTLLADGSFWAQTGPDEWNSYDAASDVARTSFLGADGTIQYQEFVGLSDNSLPVGVTVGMNPAELVGTLPGEPSDIVETAFEGRAAWEITTVINYDPSSCQETCEGEPYVQTMVTTVDQATGLVIRSSNTTTESNGTSQVSVLRDVQAVDALPVAFPGTFPDGATVDRTGDPAAAATVAVAEISAFFGIPTPIPPGIDDAFVTVTVNEGEGEDPNGLPYTSRRADIVVLDGFLETSIYISAMAVPEDGASRNGVVDGYLCMTSDADSDGACDADPYLAQTPLVEGQETVTIAGGTFAGTRALASSGNIWFSSGTFGISIVAATTAEALAIANSLEMQ